VPLNSPNVAAALAAEVIPPQRYPPARNHYHAKTSAFVPLSRCKQHVTLGMNSSLLHSRISPEEGSTFTLC
jgi:hypothetical protein